jgi:hypothetical protein
MTLGNLPACCFVCSLLKKIQRRRAHGLNHLNVLNRLNFFKSLLGFDATILRFLTSHEMIAAQGSLGFGFVLWSPGA